MTDIRGVKFARLVAKDRSVCRVGSTRNQTDDQRSFWFKSADIFTGRKPDLSGRCERNFQSPSNYTSSIAFLPLFHVPPLGRMGNDDTTAIPSQWIR